MKPRPLWQRGRRAHRLFASRRHHFRPLSIACPVLSCPGPRSRGARGKTNGQNIDPPLIQHNTRSAPRRQPQRSLGCETLAVPCQTPVHGPRSRSSNLASSQTVRPLPPESTVVRCSRLRGCHEGGLKQETSPSHRIPSQSYPLLRFLFFPLRVSLERDLALLPLLSSHHPIIDHPIIYRC
jgi:hypothetical protein